MKIEKTYFIMASAIIGIFIPTSVGGEISSYYSLLAFLVPAFLLLLSVKLSIWNQKRILYAAALFCIILIFTALSPFLYIAWGGGAPYILAVIVLLTDFRSSMFSVNRKIDQLLMFTVFFISMLILTAGLGIIFESKFWVEFIGGNYQSLSDDLFEHMIVWNQKPVTVFGSHSTAAFVYFALFAINLKIARSINLNKFLKILYLGLVIGFAVLNWFLSSNTSIAMSAFMLLFFIAEPFKSIFKFAVPIAIGIAFFILMLIIYNFIAFQNFLSDVDGNGITARYASGGRLQGTYDYLFNNYFVPIGISYSPALELGDNFIAEYIIKTSIFGYLIILYLLWSWLRIYLSLYQSVAFFAFFLIADFAYPLLVYSRVAAALPFFVLVWGRLNFGISSNYICTNKFRR